MNRGQHNPGVKMNQPWGDWGNCPWLSDEIRPGTDPHHSRCLAKITGRAHSSTYTGEKNKLSMYLRPFVGGFYHWYKSIPIIPIPIPRVSIRFFLPNLVAVVPIQAIFTYRNHVVNHLLPRFTTSQSFLELLDLGEYWSLLGNEEVV